MELNKNQIKSFVEPHLHKYLTQSNYKIEKRKAISFLTHNRFDLSFKLLYLDHFNQNISFSKEYYKDHLRAFTLGSFKEPGNLNKNSYDKYIAEFETIFNDIKSNGFDSTKSIVPISINNIIENGAHRVASAIYLNKSISVVNINSKPPNYNYKFFFDRKVSRKALDAAAIKFAEYAENLFLAFIWPSASQNELELDSFFKNIVYEKKIKLNFQGAHNLISQVYFGEEWLGTIDDNFKGSIGKIVKCFDNFEPLRVIAFQSKNLSDVLEIKNKVRQIFDIGKHSIHITDTKEESLRLSKLVFNDNGIHFLNKAKPNKFKSTHEKLMSIEKVLIKNNLNRENIILGNELSLSIYGLIEASSKDIYCGSSSKCRNFINYTTIVDEDFIFNPENFFYFKNFKFISFTKLYDFSKHNKSKTKLMKPLLKRNLILTFKIGLDQKLSYLGVFLKHSSVNFLREIGLLNLVKLLIKKFKL